jgi:hypothetical protein
MLLYCLYNTCQAGRTSGTQSLVEAEVNVPWRITMRVSFVDRLRYRFDNFMSRGTIALLAATEIDSDGQVTGLNS